MAWAFKDIDRGWRQLKRNFFGPNRTASVGIQGSEAAALEPEHGEMTNVALGVIHEFGSRDGKHPPSRPFIRSTFDGNVSSYERQSIRIAKDFFAGVPMSLVEGELLLMGESHRSDIIKRIKSRIAPALADGSGRAPLWKTGQLVNSLTVVVVPTSRRSS